MTVEIETLGQELTDKKELIVQGIPFTTGSLKERKVVLAHSGIGKVNAATTATLSSSTSSLPTFSSPELPEASIRNCAPAMS